MATRWTRSNDPLLDEEENDRPRRRPAPGKVSRSGKRYGNPELAESLPHLERIQASFGRHDVRGVEAYVGGSAGRKAESMGALGFAEGSTVGFASEPTLHTAAHEAAHVIQQRTGLKQAGVDGSDVYEEHADRVADLVVAGKSAEGEIDWLSMALRGGSGPTRAVQLKKKDQSPGPRQMRIVALLSFHGRWKNNRRYITSPSSRRGTPTSHGFFLQ